jgi:hypothetical protein
VSQSLRNDAVWRLLRDDIRACDLLVGDMAAQIEAAEIGAARCFDGFASRVWTWCAALLQTCSMTPSG